MLLQCQFLSTWPVDDGLTKENVPALGAQLQNSQVLANLQIHVSYLPDSQKEDVLQLIHGHLACFHMYPLTQMYCSMTLCW